MAERENRDVDRRLETETRMTGSAVGLSAHDVRVPALTVLAHPEARRVGELVALPELASGQEVPLSRLEPAFAAPGSSDARPLSEAYLSRRPIVLAPGGAPGSVTVKRAGSRTRAEVDGEPLAEERGLAADELEHGVVLELGRRVVLLLHWHHPVTPILPRFGLVGDSTAMERLRREIELAAGLEAPVLLRGESGTGKELVARAIHDAGPRRERPWVAVNMAAVPATLATSELFGASKGSYTGADREQKGLFRCAHGGTLFLDEIGETPPEVQPLLLRVLENGEIQPVGRVETQRVDVRVIAATDADLENRVAGGSFREPLLHRLAGFQIRLPSLRERRSDFGRLLYHFLAEELAELGEELPEMPQEAGRPWPLAGLVARLARCDWPGNVRQLRNVARRLAIARYCGDTLALGSFLEELLAGDSAGTAATAGPGTVAPGPSLTGRWRPVYRKASEVSEEELLAALRRHRFELKPTAAALGVSRTALYELIESSPRARKAGDLEAGEIEEAVARAGGDLDAAADRLEVSRQGFKRRMKALGLR